MDVQVDWNRGQLDWGQVPTPASDDVSKYPLAICSKLSFSEVLDMTRVMKIRSLRLH